MPEPLAYTEALEEALAVVVREMQLRAEAAAARGEAIIAGLLQRAAEAEARQGAFETEMRGMVTALIDATAAETAARLAELKDGEPGRNFDPAALEALRVEITRLDDAGAAAALHVASLIDTKIAWMRGTLPPPPDLSGFATKDDLSALATDVRVVRGAIPVLPDLSGYATKADVDGLPPLPDLSGFATTKDMDARLAAVGETIRDWPVLTEEDLDAAVSDEVARVVAALPPAEPGKNADMDAVYQRIADAVAAIDLEQLRGKDADPEEVRREVEAQVAVFGVAETLQSGLAEIRSLVPAEVATAVSALPPAAPGANADPEEVRRLVEATVAEALPPLVAAAVPDREELRGPPGRLPVARAWTDRVWYEGEVATHLGATWQARCDTGRPPGTDDWICLAQPGADAPRFHPRGTYDPDGDYRELDIVVVGGSSFLALRDQPGPCPGDGWQLWSHPGKTGKPGEPGRSIKGDPGDPAAAPAGLALTDDAVLKLVLNDGTIYQADFHPLLARLAQ